MMRHSEQVRLVGFIGLANTALFLAYALRRLLRLRQSTLAAVVFRRKLQTHRLLFLTGLCDLPMFAYFAAEGEYSRAVYTVHSIGKIGMLVSLGLLMDEWCSVLYMNEHLFPRPWYLSKVFLSACVIAASCCMLVNAGLIVSHRELSELHEDLYEALLIAFVCLSVGLCTLTLYTAYVLWQKLTYLGEISPAQPHQNAMRTASSRLLVNTNIFMAWILIQVAVLIASLYSNLRPSDTSPGLVILFWCLSAYLPLWGTVGVLFKLSGIRPKQATPISSSPNIAGDRSSFASSQRSNSANPQSHKSGEDQQVRLVDADYLIDVPLDYEEDVIP